MNIEYINAIPLREIFDKLKLNPTQESDLYTIYQSPFSNENAYTMEVSHETNTWYDSSVGRSGGPSELISDWLRRQELPCSLPDVIKWFRFNIGYPSLQNDLVFSNDTGPKVKLTYKSVILERGLINYVEENGIPLSIAKEYLVQLGLVNLNSKEEFTALGLKTAEESWSVYSPYLNTFIGREAVTVIPGAKYKFRNVHVFKDIFDYLSAMIHLNDNQPFNDECIILNSYKCLDNCAAYIRGFGYKILYTWFDDSHNGKQATRNYSFMCGTEVNLQHVQMIMPPYSS